MFDNALLSIQEYIIEDRIKRLLFDFDVKRPVMETDESIMEAFMGPTDVTYPISALQNITDSPTILSNQNLESLKIIILWREEMFHDLTSDMCQMSRDIVMTIFQDVCVYSSYI